MKRLRMQGVYSEVSEFGSRSASAFFFVRDIERGGGRGRRGFNAQSFGRGLEAGWALSWRTRSATYHRPEKPVQRAAPRLQRNKPGSGHLSKIHRTTAI